jgi:spore germination cell wall hydrolase CwlJ-like protein
MHYWKLRLWWYHLDKEAWGFGMLIALVLGALAFGLKSVFSYQDERRSSVREYHARNLACLARNVYYEARGEPMAGQFAVAEVTMNRKASGRYPNSVCEVVHQKNWDPMRKRYVGAFSWTEFDSLPEPAGMEWRRAQVVAEAVYYQKYEPTLGGAIFFHATHVRPPWAKQRTRVARIGRHVFYR